MSTKHLPTNNPSVKGVKSKTRLKLTARQLAILGRLAKESLTGVEVHRRLPKNAATENMVYATLAEMRGVGWVKHGPPYKKYNAVCKPYILTPRGRRMLEQHVNDILGK